MASKVPAVIAALVSLCESALSVDVHDGPPVSGDTMDYVCVGHDPGSPESALVESPWAALGQQRKKESFDVTCVAVSTSGDLSMSARRVAAYALVDAVAAALAADYTLGGVADLVSITSHSLLQEQDPQAGATAGVRFVVSVQVF